MKEIIINQLTNNPMIKESLNHIKVKLQDQCLEILTTFNKKNALISLGIATTSILSFYIGDKIMNYGYKENQAIDDLGQQLIDQLHGFGAEFFFHKTSKTGFVISLLCKGIVNNDIVARKLSTPQNFNKVMAVFDKVNKYWNTRVASSGPYTQKESENIFNTNFEDNPNYFLTILISKMLIYLKDGEELSNAIESIVKSIQSIHFPVMISYIKTLNMFVEPRMLKWYALHGIVPFLSVLTENPYSWEFDYIKEFLIKISYTVNNVLTLQQRSQLDDTTIRDCAAYGSLGYYKLKYLPTKIELIESLIIGAGVMTGYISVPQLIVFPLFKSYKYIQRKMISPLAVTVCTGVAPAIILSIGTLVLPLHVTAIFSTLFFTKSQISKYYENQRHQLVRKNSIYNLYIKRLKEMNIDKVQDQQQVQQDQQELPTDQKDQQQVQQELANDQKEIDNNNQQTEVQSPDTQTY